MHKNTAYYLLMTAIFISQRAYANFEQDHFANMLKIPIHNAFLPDDISLKDKNGQYNKIGTSFVANIKILLRIQEIIQETQNKSDDSSCACQNNPDFDLTSEQIEQIKKHSFKLNKEDQELLERLKPFESQLICYLTKDLQKHDEVLKKLFDSL